MAGLATSPMPSVWQQSYCNDVLPAICWSSCDSSDFAESQYYSGCIASDIGMVYTDLVNRNVSDDLFYDGIVQTRAVMKRCVAMGVAKIVLGCDLNFQLGAMMGETTGNCVCVYKDVDGWSAERAETFQALCVEFDLVVSNTFGHCRNKSWTPMMWGTTKDISAWDCNDEPTVPLEEVDRGKLFQIDSVCVSGHDMKTGKNLVHAAAEAVNGKRFWRSDHFPIFLKPVPLMKYRVRSK